jgi:hypothetical protein
MPCRQGCWLGSAKSSRRAVSFRRRPARSHEASPALREQALREGAEVDPAPPRQAEPRAPHC